MAFFNLFKKKLKLTDISENVLATYIPDTYHNIIADDDARDLISDVLGELSTTVSRSLGPYGRNSFLGGFGEKFTVTKDGYTILQSIKYGVQERAMMMNAVRNVARLQVAKVGDGTTSSVVIADSLYKAIAEYQEKHNVPTNTIVVALKEMKDAILSEVDKLSRPIETKEDIRRVATIASNNDTEIGNIIADIYHELGADGRVGVIKASGPNSGFKLIDGYGVDQGYLDPVFITDPKKMVVDYKNPKILMIEGTFSEDNVALFEKVINAVQFQQYQKTGKASALIVVASEFAPAITETVLIRNRRDKEAMFPVAAVQLYMGDVNGGRQTAFQDLALYVGAKPLTLQEDPLTFNLDRLGSCGSVLIKERESIFVDGNGDGALIQLQIERIEDQIDDIVDREDIEVDYSARKAKLQIRILKLQGKVAKVFVGGETAIEKVAKEYLVEDSVLATRAAMRSGVVPGGNLTLLKAANAIDVKDLVKSNKYLSEVEVSDLMGYLKEAFKASYYKLHHNKNERITTEEIDVFINRYIEEDEMFNLITEEYEKGLDIAVLNSSLTEKTILESSISIITLLVTSNQFLVSTPRKNI